jgi:hypothetical protein
MDEEKRKRKSVNELARRFKVQIEEWVHVVNLLQTRLPSMFTSVIQNHISKMLSAVNASDQDMINPIIKRFVLRIQVNLYKILFRGISRNGYLICCGSNTSKLHNISGFEHGNLQTGHNIEKCTTFSPINYARKVLEVIISEPNDDIQLANLITINLPDDIEDITLLELICRIDPSWIVKKIDLNDPPATNPSDSDMQLPQWDTQPIPSPYATFSLPVNRMVSYCSIYADKMPEDIPDCYISKVEPDVARTLVKNRNIDTQLPRMLTVIYVKSQQIYIYTSTCTEIPDWFPTKRLELKSTELCDYLKAELDFMLPNRLIVIYNH